MVTLLPIDDLDTFVATRDALHRVAEHVVAKARYVDDGEIRLMAFAGGFSTPTLGGGVRVRIEADEIVVDESGGSRRASLTTIGTAAAFVGIEPGFPAQLYPPATTFDADEPLSVDRRSAEVLAAWYGFTAEVLAMFAAEIPEAHPSTQILWPEHFDQAFYTEDADESRRANYGASPGDAGHAEPYLYVGPWNAAPPSEFWNATTFNGAVLSLTALVGAQDPEVGALRFLRAGRLLLAPVRTR
ncbi:MAG TPA: hypothetical protein VGC84_12280 [Ilumatobacteraceae bacterium]|jgi:hypothetical protein